MFTVTAGESQSWTGDEVSLFLLFVRIFSGSSFSLVNLHRSVWLITRRFTSSSSLHPVSEWRRWSVYSFTLRRLLNSVWEDTCEPPGSLVKQAFMWVAEWRWFQVWMVVELSVERDQYRIVAGDQWCLSPPPLFKDGRSSLTKMDHFLTSTSVQHKVVWSLLFRQLN